MRAQKGSHCKLGYSAVPRFAFKQPTGFPRAITHGLLLRPDCAAIYSRFFEGQFNDPL
jgi:hypothetical protein